MTFETTIGPGGPRYYIDGIEVPEGLYARALPPSKLFPEQETEGRALLRAQAREEFEAVRRTHAAQSRHRGPYFHTAITGARPLKSDALAVHTSQIPAVMARNKKRGLNVRYDRAGRPVFTDPGQRKQLMRIESEVMGVKIVKKNSFNGD